MAVTATTCSGTRPPSPLWAAWCCPPQRVLPPAAFAAERAHLWPWAGAEAAAGERVPDDAQRQRGDACLHGAPMGARLQMQLSRVVWRAGCCWWCRCCWCWSPPAPAREFQGCGPPLADQVRPPNHRDWVGWPRRRL